MAELLLRSTLDDKERHLVQSIQRSGTALLSIINDILDFSKIEAGKLQLEAIPFEVRRTIREAVELIAPAAQKKQLKLSWIIDEDVPMHLLGDPIRLRQILVNLVGNSVKFTDRGSIRVSVACEKQPDEHYGLSIAVRDTGIGVAAEQQAHIFDAFSQADGSTTRKYGGTGLGLAIVKQLVTLMRGRIELESRLGEGSTFRFTAIFTRCEPVQHSDSLPEVATTVRVAQTDQHAQSQSEMHILLVEDNPVNREVASGMLETFACRIDFAENGREALTATETKKYDLVFMDCQMPEMDGLTATRLIRERESKAMSVASVPRVPIVALTAHAMQGDRELCLAAGMDDYLTKPFTLTQLEQVLARWISKNNTKQTSGVASGMPETPVTGGQEPTVAGGGGKRSAPTADATILDQSALTAIRVLQRPGHPDIFTRIVSQYIETSQEMVARVRQAVLSKDAAELRAAAHRLKSSSAQLGAVALAGDCRELELMGASGELNRAEEVLSRFELHYESACEALQEELAKGRPAA
jgi:CheY-like chemotaxis protein/HPt (histidine-containing phosphotransfer) domain-containing protein